MMGRKAVTVYSLLVLAFLCLPIAIVIPLSFSSASYLKFPPPGYSLRWYEAYFQSTTWVEATITSFKVAFMASFIAMILGTLASYGLVRGRFPGRTLLMGFFISPLIIPSIISAIAIYIYFSRLRIIGTTLGLVLAHVVIVVPYVIATVTAALRVFDQRIEQAALSLGASWMTTFFRVTLPNILPGILGGGLFAFVVSFDEIVVSMFIAGANYTLPKKMFDDIRVEIDPTIAAVSSMLITLSILIVFVSWIWMRQAITSVVGLEETAARGQGAGKGK